MLPIRSCLILLLGLLFVPLLTGATYQSSDKIQMVDAELFGVDQSHSYFGFSIRFLGMSTVKGIFNDYSASILYNEEDMTKTSVTLIIDVTSIDTGNNWRDEDLQSDRFFDAETYPKIVFQSDRIEEVSDGFIVHGQLTMRGVTHNIAIPLRHTLKRTVDTGWGNIRVGFEGNYTLNRNEYGIHGGDFWGVKALSEEVDIEFGLLGTIMNMEKISFRSRNKPSIGEVLLQAIEDEGFASSIASYHQLSTQHPEDYNFDESELNKLGHKLLEKGMVQEALQIFELNANAYPESAQVYSSLGLAHAMLGNRKETIGAYKQALSFDPYSPHAMEMIRRLGG